MSGTPTSATATAPAGAWLGIAERGSILGMRFVVWCYRWLGRRACQLVILPVVLYFFLTDRKGRRASRHYLRRLYARPGGAEALGSPPAWRHVFRHYHECGLSILDRVGFWLGKDGDHTIEFPDQAEFTRLGRQGRGAIILGAHLGSFDALRVLARRASVVVNVVMFIEHARMINSIFHALDRDSALRVIYLDPASINSVFSIKASLDRGEFVALLADRAGIGDDKRTGRVAFLGEPATLPHGPFFLASLMKCPMIFMVALRAGPGRYRVHAERFADRVVVSGPADLDALAGEYARRLERYCLMAPYQWFNFYHSWGDDAPR
jgi:predicted LPLAT superfamily acyltransferase